MRPPRREPPALLRTLRCSALHVGTGFDSSCIDAYADHLYRWAGALDELGRSAGRTQVPGGPKHERRPGGRLSLIRLMWIRALGSVSSATRSRSGSRRLPILSG